MPLVGHKAGLVQAGLAGCGAAPAGGPQTKISKTTPCKERMPA